MTDDTPTTHEIVLPVRTLADYCRDAENARPVLPETTAIPAAEPPDDVPTFVAGQKLTPAQLARLDRAVRGIE